MTVELIIKEDEKNRATKSIKEDSNKVNFQDNIEPNIATILRINNNCQNNNIGTSNQLLKQNTMHNSKRNFSNNYIRENSPNIILNRDIKKF